MRYFSIKTLLSLALLIFTLQACKPEEVLEAGTPFSSLKGINGTWIIDQVFQVDKLSTKADNTLDVSAFFTGANPMRITFNIEALDAGITITTPSVDPVNLNATINIKTVVRSSSQEAISKTE